MTTSTEPIASKSDKSRAELIAERRRRLEAAGANWNDLQRKLVPYARRRVPRGKKDDAEDYVQKAMTQLLDPAYAEWNPASRYTLLGFTQGIVKRLILNDLGAAAQKAAAPDEQAQTAQEKAPEWQPTPESLAYMREMLEASIERVEWALGKKAVQLLLLVCDPPRDRAALLEMPVEEVYAYMDKITYYLEELRGEMKAAPGMRLRAAPNLEIQALEREIEAKLPKRARRHFEGLKALGMILIAFAFLSFLAYRVYQDETHSAPVHRETPLPAVR
jgi:DNA-directed RNA polymerase specialized sigma24 family protein